jgi:predicted nucleic acid-binding protein
MIVVLDVSAAAEILLHRAEAARLGRCVEEAEWVLAPALYTAELCNVFWKYHEFHSLSRETSEQAITQGMALPDTFSDDRELQREAFAMACLCRRPVYDMFYLVLARRHSASLLTMDKSLRALARKHDVMTA